MPVEALHVGVLGAVSMLGGIVFAELGWWLTERPADREVLPDDR